MHPKTCVLCFLIYYTYMYMYMYIVQSMYYNTCHMYAFKQWRATLGQRSHATQTNACKSVEHMAMHARVLENVIHCQN